MHDMGNIYVNDRENICMYMYVTLFLINLFKIVHRISLCLSESKRGKLLGRYQGRLRTW